MLYSIALTSLNFRISKIEDLTLLSRAKLGISILKSKNKKLSKELKKGIFIKNNLIQTIKTLKKEIQTQINNSENLTTKFHSRLEKAYMDLENINSVDRSSIYSLQEHIKSLFDQFYANKRKLKQDKTKFQLVKKDLQDSQLIVQQLHNCSHLDDEISKLELEDSKISQKYNQKRNNYQIKLNNLSKDLTEIKEKEDDSFSNFQSIFAQISFAEDRFGTISSHFHQYQNEFQQISERISQLTKKKNKYKKHIISHQKNYQLLEHNLNLIQMKKSQNEEKLKNIHQEISQIQHEIMYHKSFSASSNQIIQEKNDLLSLKQMEVKQKDEYIADLQHKIEESKFQTKMIEQQLQENNSKIKSFQTKTQKNQAQLQSLYSHISSICQSKK